MSFGTSPVDPGATPSLAVARDLVGAAVFQRVKLADATEDVSTAVGTEANALKVKPIRRGTADYDSGLVDVVTGAPASVTGSTIYPEGGTLANTSAAVRVVTLTDGTNDAIATIDLAPHACLPLAVPIGGAWAGLKAGADGAGVVLQVSGRQ